MSGNLFGTLTAGIFEKNTAPYNLLIGLIKDSLSLYKIVGLDIESPTTLGGLAVIAGSLYQPDKSIKAIVKEISESLGVEEHQVENKAFSPNTHYLLAFSEAYESHCMALFRQEYNPSHIARINVVNDVLKMLVNAYEGNPSEQNLTYNVLAGRGYLSDKSITEDGKQLLESAFKSSSLSIQKEDMPTFITIATRFANLNYMKGIDKDSLERLKKQGLTKVTRIENDEYLAPGDWIEGSAKCVNGIKKLESELVKKLF